MGIVIPPNYGTNLGSGQDSQALVLIDGSDPTVASAALSAAELAGQAHGVSVKTQQLSLEGASIGGNSNPVDVRTDVLYNPDLLGAYSIVPGLIALILFQTATSLTALAIVRERERGTMEQLIVTPIRSWELILAKITPYILVSFADTLLILVLGTLIFRRSHSRQHNPSLCHDRLVLAAHTWLRTCDLNYSTYPAASAINGNAFNVASHDAFGIHFSNRIFA